jgi:hypothetical protein
LALDQKVTILKSMALNNMPKSTGLDDDYLISAEDILLVDDPSKPTQMPVYKSASAAKPSQNALKSTIVNFIKIGLGALFAYYTWNYFFKAPSTSIKAYEEVKADIPKPNFIPAYNPAKESTQKITDCLIYSSDERWAQDVIGEGKEITLDHEER